MRVYANPDASIMAALRSVEMGAPASVRPLYAMSSAETLDFDEETNETLATALETESRRFRLAGGVLTRDGVTVTPAAPGRFFQDRDQIQQALGAIDTLIDAAQAGNLTAAQSQQALRILLRVARYVLRWIARSG